MLSIQKKEYMIKEQVKTISTLKLLENLMLVYLVLHSLCGNNMTLKPYSLLMMLWTFNIQLERVLGIDK